MFTFECTTIIYVCMRHRQCLYYNNVCTTWIWIGTWDTQDSGKRHIAEWQRGWRWRRWLRLREKCSGNLIWQNMWQYVYSGLGVWSQWANAEAAIVYCLPPMSLPHQKYQNKKKNTIPSLPTNAININNLFIVVQKQINNNNNRNHACSIGVYVCLCCCMTILIITIIMNKSI